MRAKKLVVIFALMLFLLFLLSSLGQAVDYEVLFQDTFDLDSAIYWQPLSGEWHIGDANYCFTECGS